MCSGFGPARPKHPAPTSGVGDRDLACPAIRNSVSKKCVHQRFRGHIGLVHECHCIAMPLSRGHKYDVRARQLRGKKLNTVAVFRCTDQATARAQDGTYKPFGMVPDKGSTADRVLKFVGFG